MKGSFFADALWILLSVLLLPMAGCTRPPAIKFSQVPPASAGGIGTTGIIQGQVSGSHHGQHLFLYTLADGRWWVQPLASEPRTAIQLDGSWSAQIHLGTEYAALLSKEEALPPISLDVLPTAGRDVETVALVKASGGSIDAPEEANEGSVLRFSGFDWKVRTLPGDYGAKTNAYSADNVTVDQSGALHLRLTRGDHGWTCAEMHTVRSLGFGEYFLTMKDVSQLEPAAMFSAFTYFERSTDGDHRELAFHLTRRGVMTNSNAEFRVQPSFVPTNFYHFEVPSGPLRLSLNWHPEKAEFSVTREQVETKQPIASWLFKTGVPKQDDTHLYVNFCNYGYAPSPPTRNAEVVVKSVQFFP